MGDWFEGSDGLVGSSTRSNYLSCCGSKIESIILGVVLKEYTLSSFVFKDKFSLV